MVAILLAFAVAVGVVGWLGYQLGRSGATSSPSSAPTQALPDGVDTTVDPADPNAGPDPGATRHVVGADATVSPAITGREADQWDLLVRVLGAERVVEKIETVTFYERESDDSDAAVTRSLQDPRRFHLEINLARVEGPRGQAFLFLHEYAHTLTLSADQVPEVAGRCPRLQMDEGCAVPDAYLERWHKAFWAPYGSDGPDAAEADAGAAAFYARHRDDFITEYAATNVAEDYAETFAAWVVGMPPGDGAVVRRKVAMLASDDELVALRRDLRSRLDPAWLW